MEQEHCNISTGNTSHLGEECSPLAKKRKREVTTDTPLISKEYASLAKKRNKENKFTAIGVSSFKELVGNSSIFIDKSLLIKDFLLQSAEVVLIAYPRRWGKSINMDMIKTFLEIEIDEKGNKCKDKKTTSNYKLFNEGKIDFGDAKDELDVPLRIKKDEYVMENYQGEYPVILVDFKNARGTSYAAILNEVKLAISKSFGAHQYLMGEFDRILHDKESTFAARLLAEDSRKKFKELYANNGQNATLTGIHRSLYLLTELLYKFYGKRVYVFFDEYDAPINCILQTDIFSERDFDATLNLFDAIMVNTFKGNEYLEKGLITGVFKLVERDFLYSGFNNAKEYCILDTEFAQHYGFNQEEVETLFKEYNISPELSQQCHDWYDGYTVLNSNLHTYNPWSIVNFLDTKRIKNYWAETGNIDFIKNLFKINEIKSNIEDLINKKDICVELNYVKFSRSDFLTLKELVGKSEHSSVTSRGVNLLFAYLLATGYLTLNNLKNRYLICIMLPNGEIADELSRKLKSYYETLYKIPSNLFNDATNELQKLSASRNDTTEFKVSLEK